MFETLKRLYDSGQLDNEELANAVVFGWITEEDYELITGVPYAV